MIHMGASQERPSSRIYAPNRIQQERKLQKITQLDLAMAIDTTPATIAKLENRQMGFSLDYMLAIANALKVPPERLLPETKLIPSRVFPVLGRVPAGNWREAIEHYERSITVADTGDLGGPNSYALLPDGDSMDQIVDDGGFIIIDPEQLDLVDRKPYVVMNEAGETTFKRYRASPPRLEPCSSNPAHTTIVIGREPFTITGQVTYAGGLPK